MNVTKIHPLPCHNLGLGESRYRIAMLAAGVGMVTSTKCSGRKKNVTMTTHIWKLRAMAGRGIGQGMTIAASLFLSDTREKKCPCQPSLEKKIGCPSSAYSRVVMSKRPGPTRRGLSF